MKRKKIIPIFFIVGILCLGPGMKGQASEGSEVLFEKVEKIFAGICAQCHSSKKPPRGLILEPGKFLDYTLNVPSREVPEYRLIDIFNPSRSYLLMKVKGDPGIKGSQMPLDLGALTRQEIDAITQLINALAKGIPGQYSRKAEAPSIPAKKLPTFAAPQLVNLPTTRMIGKKNGLFRVSHRFQPAIETGYDTFYGLDGPAAVLLSFGYGLGDRLNLTIGRTNSLQTLESSVKWLVFDNRDRSRHPLALALISGASVITQDISGNSSVNRWKFNFQLSLSWQLSDRFAFLLSPGYSTNTDHWADDPEGTLALGIGAKFMLFNNFSIIGEGVPVISGYRGDSFAWGMGLEYKIGKHVFQGFIQNSIGLTTDQFIAGRYFLPDDRRVRFGFNLFRYF